MIVCLVWVRDQSANLKFWKMGNLSSIGDGLQLGLQ